MGHGIGRRIHEAPDVPNVFEPGLSQPLGEGLVITIDEAKKAGMKVIYSTVGRRDGEGGLRPLTAEELATKDQPLINIPLECGFDLEP